MRNAATPCTAPLCELCALIFCRRGFASEQHCRHRGARNRCMLVLLRAAFELRPAPTHLQRSSGCAPCAAMTRRTLAGRSTAPACCFPEACPRQRMPPPAGCWRTCGSAIEIFELPPTITVVCRRTEHAACCFPSARPRNKMAPSRQQHITSRGVCMSRRQSLAAPKPCGVNRNVKYSTASRTLTCAGTARCTCWRRRL